jgi:lipopolysaccharide export system protein LptA
MSKHFTYYLLVIFNLLSGVANSQSQIEIVNADKIYYNKKISEDRQVLIGNVKTKHKDRFLTCDSAYFYSKENKIEAFSNIHIWQGDTLSLRGDYLIYHGNHQLAEIERDVVFNHNDMQLVSEELKYNFEFEKGFYDHNALITQNDKSLSSTKGIYYSKIEKFDFYKNVVVADKEETLKADTLHYWLNTEYVEFNSNGTIENEKVFVKAQQGWLKQLSGKAFLSDNVTITSLKDSSVLHTDTCYFYDQMNRSKSYGHTLLASPFNQDTLFISADTLIHTQSETDASKLHAFNNVYYKSSQLLGQCDSLSYISTLERIYLNKEPIMWLDEYQLTADTIIIQLESNELNTSHLLNDAFICSSIDTNYYNQISGQNMNAFFKENDLNNIYVEGNGESIYYVQNSDSLSPIGMNEILCSNMNIIVANREIKNINFYEKPNAVLHPIKDLNKEDLFLKGFKWIDKAVISNKIAAKIRRYYSF